MSQFKPGDLCLVIGAPLCPKNIGKSVELVQRVAAGAVFTDQAGGRAMHAGHADSWEVVGDDLFCCMDGVVKPHASALIYEYHLVPLHGDFAPEREKSSEVPV